MKQTTNNLMHPVWVVTLDILLGAVILLTFTFFHHVLPRVLPAEVDETGAVYTKAPSTEGQESGVFTGSVTAPNIHRTEPATGGSTGDSTAPTAPVTPGNTEPTTPIYDLSGDFGYKFAPLFAQDDSIYQDATTYQSHDIYMTLRSFDGTAKQLTKRGGDSYSNTHVVYHVMDIYVRNVENLFCSYSQSSVAADKLYGDTTFGKSVTAISGDLFGNYPDKNVIVRNGKVIRKADYITRDICVLYFDGTMETISPEDYSWEAIEAKGPYQIWCFGPGLLDDGKVKEKLNTDVWPKNPRSAIGYVEPGHYVLVSVNGIREEAERETHGDGANMDFLAQIMSEAGCKSAYNLDGGASVYAYWGDRRLVEINGGKRPISDLICVGEVGGN